MKKLLLYSIVLILFASCNKDGDFNNYNNYITYKFGDTTKLLADDSTKLKVTITTQGASDGDYFTVTLPAALGTLQNADASGKVYIQNNTATFSVTTSNTPGAYLLSTQFKDKTTSFVQSPVRTRPALPDYILVDASQSLLDSSSTAKTFLLTLKRNQGMVSQGTGVRATAYQINAAGTIITLGRFTGLNATINASSQITVSYFADTGGFNPALPVYFKFSCTNNAGQEVKTIYTMKFK